MQLTRRLGHGTSIAEERAIRALQDGMNIERLTWLNWLPLRWGHTWVIDFFT